MEIVETSEQFLNNLFSFFLFLFSFSSFSFILSFYNINPSLLYRHEKVRELHIEKSSFPLGIQIIQGSAGGIFVTSVSEGSVAKKADMRYGDQILEVIKSF